MLEYRANKEAEIAQNIFNKGLKFYPTDMILNLEYLRFLADINDETSTLLFYL